MKEDFLEVVRHMAEQIDLTNFDQELAHSGMRAVLQMTCGRSMDFATAAELRLGSQIADFHRYLAPPQPRRGRGRPKHKCGKRKRFDAWNAFVREHRPTQAGQASIKSGYCLSRPSQISRLSVARFVFDLICCRPSACPSNACLPLVWL